jgi:hypothetical protein
MSMNNQINLYLFYKSKEIKVYHIIKTCQEKEWILSGELNYKKNRI